MLKIKSDFKNALIMFELSNSTYDSLNTSTKREIIKKGFQLEYDKKAAADSVKYQKKKITLLKLNQEKFKKYLFLVLVLLFCLLYLCLIDIK
ncbi:MAG: hypothetical protein U0V03_11580 [Bacteroidia bacterium]